MDNDPKQDRALDALFETAKTNPIMPEPDLMAQLQSDMERALPRAPAPIPTPKPSVLTRLGGLFAASGLTGVAALGVWIGFVMPETLNTLADGFAGDQIVSLDSLLPGADLIALSD